jgi:acyl-CoA dehydrogenase
MSASENMLMDAANRLFGDLCTDDVLRRAENGEWLAAGWQAIEEIGLPLALVDESAGGFGFDPVEALGVVRLAGAYALPLPIGETMLANRVLAQAGLAVRPGVASIAPAVEADVLRLERQSAGWRVTGNCRRVPWGRHAETIAVLATHGDQFYVAAVRAGGWSVQPGTNIAGAPRDMLSVDANLADDDVSPVSTNVRSHLARGAAIRTLTIAGALERILDLTVGYAAERVQFGRPIGAFQVTQHSLSVLATQVCAASAAADMAARALASSDTDILPFAIAKARVGEAASMGAAITHQVHGAIGFTAEHRLHFFTKLLWSCRDEFGSEAFWNCEIGRRVAAAGPDELWPLLASL